MATKGRIPAWCSPLLQTNGKSAGMVWGRLDHFCDRQFGRLTRNVLQLRILARNCGKVVGSSVDARSSDFKLRRVRAWSRGLQNLGAIRPMVLARRARQNGLKRGIFLDFHFCGAITRAHERLRRLPFATWLIPAWSQGLQSLGAIGSMVLARLAQKRVKQGDCCTETAKSAPSLQSVHLAHLEHTL